jgi:ribosomal protein L12E/L44/L45/RPP1/RPP2
VNDQDQKWIAEVVDRLQLQFPQQSKDALTAVVHDCHREFEDSRIRDFVPILVERRAREALSEPLAPARAAPIPVQRHEAGVAAPVTQAASP